MTFNENVVAALGDFPHKVHTAFTMFVVWCGYEGNPHAVTSVFRYPCRVYGGTLGASLGVRINILDQLSAVAADDILPPRACLLTIIHSNPSYLW
jgi:hypothetical protein